MFDYIQYFLVIIISAALGSFSNNLISFYAGQARFDKKRSYTQCCKKAIWYSDMFPVVSYLMLQGKCRFCGSTIPLRYFLIECAFILMGIFYFLQFGISAQFIIYFLSGLILVIIAAIDFKKFIIPNIFVLLLLSIALLKFIFVPTVLIKSNLIISSVMFLLLLSIKKIYLLVQGKSVIGYGDIKLISVLFLLVDFPLSFIGLWISALSGIIGYSIVTMLHRDKGEKKIPFGFYLGTSFIVIILFNNSIISLYYSLIGGLLEF